MAQATEELVAELTEKQGKQVKALIKLNNEAIAKLTAAILGSKSTPSAPLVATGNSEAMAKAAAKKAAW
jgi:hypothetical protein